RAHHADGELHRSLTLSVGHAPVVTHADDTEKGIESITREVQGQRARSARSAKTATAGPRSAALFDAHVSTQVGHPRRAVRVAAGDQVAGGDHGLPFRG